jgi:M6 family metalloprotease-like protein
MPAGPASRSSFRAVLAVLLSAVLVALAAPFAASAVAAPTAAPAAAPGGPEGAATASGFLFYKYPLPGVCTGSALNVSNYPHYSRDDCGFVRFTLSEALAADKVKAELYGPNGEKFATVNATKRTDAPSDYNVNIRPDNTWAQGEIRMLITADGAAAGEAQFGLNLLGADIAPAPGAYKPGEPIPVSGEIKKLDSESNLANDEEAIPTRDDAPEAKFDLVLVSPEGQETQIENVTTDGTGHFEATIPGAKTQDITAGPETNYEITLGVAAVKATYNEPGTGEWYARRAGSGAVTFRVPPTGLILENSFVSAVGWVKPGEGYPSRVFVRNFTNKTFNNVKVEVTAPTSTSILKADPGTSGTAEHTQQRIIWNIGTVEAAREKGQTIKTLVIESQADTLKEDPRLVWKDLSSTAELTVGGNAKGSSTSHGPRVIPQNEVYDTARFGDRPFPVVPVDYLERKHLPSNSGDELAGKINSPTIPGSTFNLYQEMSVGQLFPNGTVPSSGIATRGFEYEPGFNFTQVQPNGVCRGASAGDAAGTPGVYDERIRDGFYQLPGNTEYYGSDRFGSALPGAVAGVGPLFDIDSACGPTGKLVYDSAVIADPEIDYSDYDTDKDGVVDFFMVVFAGCGGNGASQTGCGGEYTDAPYDNVWPHSSSLEFYYTDEETGQAGYVTDDQLKNLEGENLYYTSADRGQMTTDKTEWPVFVRVGPYNVNPETAIDRASVISHEYGHSLGLPDFYSLGNRDTYGDWNLMATDKSQNMDIFSRQEMGWIVPDVLEPGSSPRVNGWKDSKEDTHTINWQTKGGTPYTLRDGEDGPVHNAQAYVAKLPGRQLIDPAKFDTGDTATKSHAWWSGSGNDFGCSPEGGHNLDVVVPGLRELDPASDITLEFKSLWDIEWDYDYGFVLTTRGDSQQSVGTQYVPHESEQGYTTGPENNPNANACKAKYQFGITGSSGSYKNNTVTSDRLTSTYPESVFLADKYDISDLAGAEEGVVRFSYATDPGLARPGWFIDDIKITATEPGGQPQVLLNTDLEDESQGGPDSPYFFPGGCKDDTTVASRCTPGWNYISSSAGSDADHAYYMELRDRSGFDESGKGENDRAPIDFAPGLSLVYTDEAHGYGNVGTDNPPAQSPLDSQPQPENNSPLLADAAWTAAAGDNRFSDSGDGHVDNYTDENGGPWTFKYNCLTFDVLSMDGTDIGPSQSTAQGGNLTGDVKFNIGTGCGVFDYGYVDEKGGGGTDPGNTAPVARAEVKPKAALKSRQFTFDAGGSTDKETPDQLDYSWRFGDESGTEKTAGQVTMHKYAKAGVYTATVTVIDPRGETDTDSVKVYVNQRVQCSKPSVTQTGGWRTKANGSAQKNHYCVNDRNRDTAGDSMRFSFTGPRLDIGYGKGKTGRSAFVFIDGRERGKISFHNRRDKPQFGFERNYRRLGGGEHTVELVVLPPKGDRRYAFMDSFTFAGRVAS